MGTAFGYQQRVRRSVKLRRRPPGTGRCLLPRRAADDDQRPRTWLTIDLTGEVAGGETLGQLEDLVYAVPDPQADRAALLALADPTSPPARRLAGQLRTKSDWRRSPLRELLPGLTLINPTSFSDYLGTRTVVSLARADIHTWAALGNMSPDGLLLLDGIGKTAAEEILLAAAGEWASAHLRSAQSPRSDQEPLPRPHGDLRDLLGRAPDPTADRQLLSMLRDPTDPDTRWLVERICTESDLRCLLLRELLPGLGLGESPHFSIRLSVRAANCLARVNVTTLTALAGMTPAAILEMPEVGLKTVEEILLVAVDSWAVSYLTSVEDSAYGDRPKSRASSDSDAEIGQWGVSTISLADAFTKIEQVSGFGVFRRRQLDPDHPTQAKVAKELGVSGSRVSQQERTMQMRLLRRMRNNDWPIARAVDGMQNRLGAVAFLDELQEALAVLDPTGKVLPDDLPHRRMLLLHLGSYCISGQWVLGPDIESLTKAVLGGLSENGPTNLDRVNGHLARLGIREEVRLPWIISQPGFQIVNDELVRAVGE